MVSISIVILLFELQFVLPRICLFVHLTDFCEILLYPFVHVFVEYEFPSFIAILKFVLLCSFLKRTNIFYIREVLWKYAWKRHCYTLNICICNLWNPSRSWLLSFSFCIVLFSFLFFIYSFPKSSSWLTLPLLLVHNCIYLNKRFNTSFLSRQSHLSYPFDIVVSSYAHQNPSRRLLIKTDP